MQPNKSRRKGRRLAAFFLLTIAVVLAAGAFSTTVTPVNGAPAVQLHTTPTAARTSTATPTPVRGQLTATPVAAAASPAQTAKFNGLPVGFAVGGQAAIGDPEAPIVLHEYSDYLCPFCERHFQETYPLLLDEYVAAGQVRLVSHDFPIPSLHPTAPVGHQAALCVAEQGPALFWAMHDALFARQSEWSELPDPAEFVGALAEEMGADPVEYAACMASARTADAVEAGMADGTALGFNATPSFRLERPADGYTFDIVGAYPIERFREVIDAMLAGEEAPAEPTPEPPKLPYWADEGLAPDPERPGFTLAGDAYKGSEDAVLTIVEFSDFQCPACATHALEVQPALDKQYVDTGSVRWVYKNLPLQIHPQAPAAATAAECAGDQGQFWEMHDTLFAKQAQWANDAVDTELARLADDLELDATEFSACLNSRQALERVLPDIYDAIGIIDSTPTFVILANGQGTIVNGTQSLESFTRIVDGFLANETP